MLTEAVDELRRAQMSTNRDDLYWKYTNLLNDLEETGRLGTGVVKKDERVREDTKSYVVQILVDGKVEMEHVIQRDDMTNRILRFAGENDSAEDWEGLAVMVDN